ncbi:hypothetical protein ACFVIY_17885 [Streptomyces sp. NPDC127166]|uniref:hypothetical protein n=1 Tax=Streptomyces sp. NPDC127166 TaxID=3345380 RepID=UPI003632118F
MNDHTACDICNSDLWDDELGRLICRPCQQRIDQNLRSIAGPRGLYARLCLRTTPGKGNNGPAVSGTRGSSMPPSLHVLNLIADGGIVSDLETWVDDWASHGLAQTSQGGRLQHRIDQAVRTLRLNLPQAAYRHPALKNFNDEVHAIIRRCKPIVDNEKPLRQIYVTCPCGRTISLTLATHGETCPGCETAYNQRDVKQLPLAERQAAA